MKDKEGGRERELNIQTAWSRDFVTRMPFYVFPSLGY
jgi:hypothetical protein